MFLRRRFFLGLDVSRVLPPILSAQGTSLATYRFASSQRIVEAHHVPCLDTRATSLKESSRGHLSRPSPDLQGLSDEEVLQVIHYAVETRSRIKKSRKPVPDYISATFTDAYLELRCRHFAHVKYLIKTYPEMFVHITEHCSALDEVKVIETAAEDFIVLTRQLYEAGDVSEQSMVRHYRSVKKMFESLLSRNKRTPSKLISSQQHVHMLAVLEMLLSYQRSSDSPPRLTNSDLNVVLKSIISSDWGHFTTLFDALLRYLQDMPAEELLVNLSPKIGAPSALVKDYMALSLSFIHFVHLLLNKGFHQLSFSFLEALVEKSVVPPQALNSSDPGLDFRDFVIAVLVRWCLHHGRTDRALDIISAEDLTNTDMQEHYSSLVNDLCMRCIVPDASKLEQCNRVVDRILSQNPSIKLPNTLIHTFFRTACKARAGKAAERMYARLGLTIHRDHYVKGLLYGGVLEWLLSYFIHKGKDPTLGERLAQDLVNSTTPIKLYERGDIIALCAAGGYVSETRSLWERYATGSEERMVTGHTKCMVGIVKLFQRMSDINAKSPHNINGKLDVKGTKESISENVALKAFHEYSSGAQNHDFEITSSGVTRQKTDNENHESSFVPEVPSNTGTPSSSVGSNITLRSEDLEPEATATSKSINDSRDNTGAVLTSSDVELRVRGDDFEPVSRNPVVAGGPGADEHLDFAHRVLDAYRRAKEPLQRASHYDLNALARASDLLGNARQSMAALQTILDRKEVPDTRDLNVVIIAMAERDPQRAEEMLAMMLKERMHMNALSFSAVVIGWLDKGNTKRASRVYSRAIHTGHAKLTSDAATPLLVALVDACSGDERDASGKARADVWVHRTFLRQVCSLIESEACPISAIPTNLIEQCIGAALRFREAGLAFYFWKQLSRESALRETVQQRELRHGILSLVKKATEKGMMGTEEGRRMIAEMGSEAEP